MCEDIENEESEDEFLTIQKMFSQTGNYFTIQQSINRGHYNSLFKKIEDKEEDLLVDFFVNAYYVFTNIKEDKLIIKSKSAIKNVSMYCENYSSFIFFDRNIDVVSAYDFDEDIKQNYIDTINLSLLKIIYLSPLFNTNTFNIDRLDFYFKIINLILYKTLECKKIIKMYGLKRSKRFKFSTHIVELNKKNILKNNF